jgi:hypothetical protein
MDDDSTSMIWASAVVGFLFTVAYYRMFGKHSERTQYEHPLPPRSEFGFFETLQQFSSSKFHEWSLE